MSPYRKLLSWVAVYCRWICFHSIPSNWINISQLTKPPFSNSHKHTHNSTHRTVIFQMNSSSKRDGDWTLNRFFLDMLVMRFVFDLVVMWSIHMLRSDSICCPQYSRVKWIPFIEFSGIINCIYFRYQPKHHSNRTDCVGNREHFNNQKKLVFEWTFVSDCQTHDFTLTRTERMSINRYMNIST